jgi:2-polyprenyl-3-methyl-5-hydroxy-6-metoxy-1,4-benzoquinol methylase
MQLKNNLSTKVQYDQWWNNYKQVNEEEPGTVYRAKLVVDTINILSDISNVVDVGCGAGELIQKIIKGSKRKLQITGLDVSTKIIRINKKRFKNVNFSTIDLSIISKYRNTYDLVINSEVIEHLNNWKNGIYNLCNLTNISGYLIITTQSGKIYAHHKTLGHLKHFRKEEIEKELVKNNFIIVESYYAGWPFMNIKNWLLNYSILGMKKNVLKETEPNIFNKIIYKIFDFLYKISSKQHGPQIFILARKL